MPIIVSGKGNVLITDKNEYWFDTISGIFNVSLGHKSQPVIDALHDVIDSGLINSYENVSWNNLKLRALLMEYAPKYTWQLVNSGGEAIERCIQIAATHLKKPPIIAVTNVGTSFHGKTIATTFPRYGHGVAWGNPLNMIEIDPSDDCPHFDALIYEPVNRLTGEIADEPHLRWLCDERNALLIADEMITGFLRCGRRFMSRTADMIACGKGIAQGSPLAAVGMRRHLPVDLEPMGWSTTAGGNNLTSTIALFTLRYLIENEVQLLNNVAMIEDRLEAMGFNVVGALGFMKVKDPQKATDVFNRKKVVSLWRKEHLRVGPAFITTGRDLDLYEAILKEAVCQS